MALMHHNFYSKYLGNTTDLNVILPDMTKKGDPACFYTRDKRYKVLLLLHGRGEDYTMWSRMTNIETYALENDLMVVMPSGFNSNWMDWDNYGMGLKYGDFLMKEVMAFAHNWLPGSDKKEDNFVVGCAMGGHGALKTAMNNPDCFGGVAAFSCNEREFPDYYELALKKGDKSVIRWIDRVGGIENFIKSDDNLRRVIREAAAAGKKFPKLYVSTGGADDPMHMEQFYDWADFCKKSGAFEDVKSNVVEGYTKSPRLFEHEIQEILEYFGFDISKGMKYREKW